jgi:hypothetical protein
VAFGSDGNALVVTTTAFIEFSPTLGTTQVLETIAQVATSAIPQPVQSFPGNIVQASIAVSRDGSTIAGFGGNSPYLLFRYNVATQSDLRLRSMSPRRRLGRGRSACADNGALGELSPGGSQDANFVTTAEFA